MTSQRSEMTREEAIEQINQIFLERSMRTLPEWRVRTKALTMAIEALRREGEFEKFVRDFLWDFSDLDERMQGYSAMKARLLISQAKKLVKPQPEQPADD